MYFLNKIHIYKQMKDFNQILKEHERYIQFLSSRLGQDDADVLADLVQEGSIGLWIAYSKFDSSKDVPFTKYALWWIKAYMYAFLQKNGRTIKLPANMVNALVKLGDDDPNEVDIEDGFDKYQLAFIRLGYKPTISLNTKVDEFSSILEDLIPSIEEDDTHLEKDVHMALNEFLISEDKKDIIKMYYGIEPFEKHTMEEIADKYGCTRENVRQHIKKTLKKMKNENSFKRIRIGNIQAS